MGKVLLVVVCVALSIYCLFDIGAMPHRRIRTLPKPVWFVVVLVPLVGPVWWLWSSYGAPRQAAKPAKRMVGPDDDTDFLGRINRAEQRSLNAWEEELRRRERDSEND